MKKLFLLPLMAFVMLFTSCEQVELFDGFVEPCHEFGASSAVVKKYMSKLDVTLLDEDLDENYNRHIIGETCLLYVGDEYSSIDDIYFTGIHFEEKTANSNPTYPRYIETGLIASDFSEIENPKQGEVYLINSQRYIYYNEQWYLLNDNNDIKYPVQAMVDYSCEVMKGVY